MGLRRMAAIALAAAMAGLGAGGPAAAGELFAGALAHDVDTPLFGGNTPEEGTVDIEVGYRTERLEALRWIGRPRLSAKAQINTSGRTDFFTAELDWRKHLFGSSLYVQGGLGVTYQDGYDTIGNPYDPGLSAAERARRFTLSAKNKSFGSPVLFDLSGVIGYDLSERWAVEGVWDHYSHARLFGSRNPGIEEFGVKVVYRFGER